ncbi:MAG: TIGR03862 family flavoprotein [Bacteroidota bacterium]
MQKKSVIIIGGGPASLMLACSLNTDKVTVSIYEKNAALGRKFLVAGKGGFNLTHSENLEQFSERYHPNSFIKPFLKCFSNIDLRNWLKSVGIETYVGTSKRVFPIKGIKPIEVLKAVETQLRKNNINVFCNYEWKGWTGNKLVFLHETEEKIVSADLVVFALGGASWKVTGSDGSWTSYLKEKGINILPFYPSNCAFKINWEPGITKQISGQALKNCEFSCGPTIKKGEAVLTDFGIEGSGVYALSKEIRTSLISNGRAELIVDFKPDLSLQELLDRFESNTKLSVKDILEKKVNLSAVQIQLLKNQTSKEDYHQPNILCSLIKSYPIMLVDFAPIDESISTVGGIDLKEVTENLELKKLPNHFCIGEMLDWDAPTGGYLLQACFSMGKFLADKLKN